RWQSFVEVMLVERLSRVPAPPAGPGHPMAVRAFHPMADEVHRPVLPRYLAVVDEPLRGEQSAHWKVITLCARRLFAISMYSAFSSSPMAWHCRFLATSSVVPEPLNGSRTIPPPGQPARMQGLMSSSGKVAKWASGNG